MIMVSHNIVDAFDKKYPASLSKKVHKYIRNEMNYDGVIITDGLGMNGVVDFVGGDKGEAAIKSVLAGNDMLCANNYKIQYPAVLKAVKDGKIKEKQIDESVKRINRNGFSRIGFFWQINFKADSVKSFCRKVINNADIC